MNRRLLAVAVCVSLIASVVGGLVGPVAAHAASGRECDVTGESDRFPVVLIHGFATKSETIAGDWKPASDAIIAAGGQPVLFDWAGESWDWVTKKGADKRLRASIECLAAKAGGPVFVVAHSMGGLLLRAAFQDGLDTHLVAGAVTIATPHEGISLDQTPMADPRFAGVAAAFCTANLVFLVICAGPLGGQVNNLFSGAAAAMAAGSTEMNQLKPWPDSVPATFIAGEITLCDNTFWLKFGCENKGFDPLVKVDSALASNTVSAPNISRVTIRCETSWGFLLEDARNDFDHVPCSHGPLRRQPETLTAITTMVGNAITVDRKACTEKNIADAVAASDNPKGSFRPVSITDLKCQGEWAQACPIHPVTGDTDCTSYFHLSDGRWATLNLLWDACGSDLRAAGMPKNVSDEFGATDLRCEDTCPNRGGNPQFCAGDPSPDTTAVTSDPLLGLANWNDTAMGFGVARPDGISYSGVCCGILNDITWSTWGGTIAEGDGTGPNVVHSVDGTNAGAPEEPAHIVAWDLGTCGGKSAYRKVRWYFAGEHWSPTDKSDYDICNPM